MQFQQSKASTEEDSGGGENAIETHSKEKAHSTEARVRAATNSRVLFSARY